MPASPEKQVALLSAYLERGSKGQAQQAVEYYEKNCFQLPILKDQKAFDLYLAALSIASNGGSAVKKLTAASQRRDDILQGVGVPEMIEVPEEPYVVDVLL